MMLDDDKKNKNPNSPVKSSSSSSSTIPKTMKAAQGKDYGDIDEMISVEDHVPYPNLAELFPNPKRRNQFMIVKTHAVALACGDVRVLSGLTKELQGPPSFPYIPCGDCSGIVVEIPQDNNTNNKDNVFQVGDRVCARFVMGPRNALAEYAVVHRAVCEKVPDNVSSVDAAALAGACPAMLLAERMQPNEQRILILGAGGGVGSHVCQILRACRKNVSYLVGVSQTPERLLQPPLSYHQAIDYTQENVFSKKEFQDHPFDVVIDLAGGGWLDIVNSYNSPGHNNHKSTIVKPASQGGRYLTLVPDKAIFEAHSIASAMKIFLWIPLWRAIKSRVWARHYLPKYTFAHSLDQERSHLTRTLELASKGTIQAVVDPNGPFSFTTEGVRKAFRLQESRHGHGKVIVQVSK